MPSSGPSDSAGYASQALAEVERRRIRRPRDRWVHAAANAGFGLLIGLWIGPARLVNQDRTNVWLTLAYMGLLVGLVSWQARTASTWPRGARWISLAGGIGTLVVGAFVHMALNWYGQDHALGIPLLLAAAGLIALPLVIAGAVVALRLPR